MKRWWLGTAAVPFLLGASYLDDPPKKADPPAKSSDDKKDEKKDDTRTPMEKFKDAKKDLDAAQKKFQAAIAAVQAKGERPSLNDKDIRESYEAQNKAMAEVSKYALEAGKADPKSKDGADALFFAAQRVQPGTKAGDELFDLLLTHHMNDARLAQQLANMMYGRPSPSIMKLLERVEAESKTKDNLATAKLVRGKLLLRAKPTAEQGEKLLEQVMTEFKDVKIFGRPIAAMAEGDLFEHRYLAEGKPVPEIEGEDVDGVKFKISDYKGKVVMLDFWGHW